MACLLIDAGRALKNTGLQFKGVLGLKKGKCKDTGRDLRTIICIRGPFVNNVLVKLVFLFLNPNKALEEIYEREGWTFAYLQQQRFNCVNYPVKQYKF